MTAPRVGHKDPGTGDFPVLAVDPGLKRIGLAVSDLAGISARALEILPRRSVDADAHAILDVVRRECAREVLIGTTHEKGAPATPVNRYAHRLLAALRSAAGISVRLRDESLTTRAAQAARLARGDRLHTRREADDSLAAAALLQEYLDARS